MVTKDEMPACPVATTVSLIGSKWKNGESHIKIINNQHKKAGRNFLKISSYHITYIVINPS